MFNGGADQFNGGGFMPQEGGGSAKKGGYQSQDPSTRRVSVKMLHDATVSANTLIVDGKEIANVGRDHHLTLNFGLPSSSLFSPLPQVALVGKVVSIARENLTTNLVLDDTTGRITVKVYADSDNDDTLEAQRMAELRAGIIVRVFGHLAGNEGDRYVTAFGARPVTDFNEVTYHLAQIIFQHKHLTKGGAELAGAGGAAYGGAPAAAAAPAAAGFDNGNLTAIQAEVKAAFAAPDAMSGEAGLTAADVMARTGGRFTAAQVREAITHLVDDGQLYSTIDDDHWKACA